MLISAGCQRAPSNRLYFLKIFQYISPVKVSINKGKKTRINRNRATSFPPNCFCASSFYAVPARRLERHAAFFPHQVSEKKTTGWIKQAPLQHTHTHTQWSSMCVYLERFAVGSFYLHANVHVCVCCSRFKGAWVAAEIWMCGVTSPLSPIQVSRCCGTMSSDGGIQRARVCFRSRFWCHCWSTSVVLCRRKDGRTDTADKADYSG